MNPVEARRVLRMLWWLQLIVGLLPVTLFPRNTFSLALPTEQASLIFFVLALCLLFLNIKPFARFKHAVIAVGKARASEQESEAWQQLMHARLRALWVACLPAGAAAIAKVFGLGMPIVVLLAVATPVLFWLYRTPRQLS